MTKPTNPQIECPACDGTGKTGVVAYRLRDGRLTITKETCELCNGTGKVDEWQEEIE